LFNRIKSWGFIYAPVEGNKVNFKLEKYSDKCEFNYDISGNIKIIKQLISEIKRLKPDVLNDVRMEINKYITKLERDIINRLFR
jgi:hypothetical protein